MVKTLADIAGDGQTHPITSDSNQKAAWVQFIVTGAGTARIGDSSIGASQGLPIPAGGGMFLPWRKQPEHAPYVLGQLYYNVPVGAVLSIAYSTD